MAIKRTLIGGALKALRGLENIASVSPEKAAGLTAALERKGVAAPMESPAPNRLSNNIQESLGYSNQELEPQGLAENIAQGAIGAAPFAAQGLARGGIEGVKKVGGQILSGQTARAGLETVGAPEWAQLAGQLAAEGATTIPGLKKSGKAPTLKEHTSAKYQEAKNALGKNEKGSSKSIKSFLDKANNLWKTETHADTRKIVEEAANTISQNVDKNGNIDIGNAWENKKALSKQYSTAKPGEKPYIEEARKGLEAVLKDHSPANPQFAKLMNEADRLNTYKYSNNIIGDFFDGKKGKLWGAFKLTGLPLAMRGMEAGSRIALNPAVRKYYGKLLGSIIEDASQKNIHRYAVDFNNAWNKAEEKLGVWVDVPDEGEWIDAD